MPLLSEPPSPRLPAQSVASRVVGGYQNRTWTELVLRSLARETNLLLASTRFLIVGSGPVAEGLARRLAIFGAHVAATSHNPVELVEIRHGLAVAARLITAAPFIPGDADIAIATGEHHPTVTPDAVAASTRPLVLVDAALPAAARAVDRKLFVGAEHADRGRWLSKHLDARPTLVAAPVPVKEFDRAVAGVQASYAALSAVHGPSGADAELARELLW